MGWTNPITSLTATWYETLHSVLNTLEGQVLFEDEEQPVHLRLARHDGIYLDLGTPDWRAVQISPDGWQVVSKPPVRFRRSRGMLLLPLPEPGGDISERKLV